MRLLLHCKNVCRAETVFVAAYTMLRTERRAEAPATLFEKHETQSAFSHNCWGGLLQNGHPLCMPPHRTLQVAFQLCAHSGFVHVQVRLLLHCKNVCREETVFVSAYTMLRSESEAEAPATLFDKHDTQSAFSHNWWEGLLQNGHPLCMPPHT
jgi:hypothetical protein